MEEKYLRQFDENTVIPFQLINPDGIDFSESATFATGDVFIMRDEAAESQTSLGVGTPDLSTLITDEGTGYSIALDKADVAFKRIIILIKDQTVPKVWLDARFVIETTNNASAQHPNINAPIQLSAPALFVSNGQTETQVTVDLGSNVDTRIRGLPEFIFSHDGVDLDLELLFNVGVGELMVAFEVEAGLFTNGNRTATIQLRDFGGASFDVIKTMTDTSGNIETFLVNQLDPKYTDGSGNVRMRFKSVDLQSGNAINVEFAQVIANINTGAIPSVPDIAIGVELLNASIHGPGNHEGLFIVTTRVDTVNSQTNLELDDGPPQDITGPGFSVIIRDFDDLNVGGVVSVVSWTIATNILITDSAIPGYTIAVKDGVRFFKIIDIDKQTIRDAQALATAEVAAPGSIDDKLDNIGGPVTLDSSAANKLLIAEAIKDFDASLINLDANSILSELFNKVYGVNLIQVNGQPNADGKTFLFIFEAMAAMACGKFTHDLPLPGETTFFKANGTTPLFIVKTTDLTRTRIL